ncbi:hypothetical protein [Xanthomonas albilineans]|uniref:hypothetical protein n=1 Tax=Xanthomonas albilineans TaxID=29447 RepID=UPI0012D457EE|nr:hypothetical protein [Xanthomonas albilineans]
MSDNVVRLAPTIADRLRSLASDIESGKSGQVNRVCIALDRGDEFDCVAYGRSCSRAELIGVLEWAKSAIMSGVTTDA